jgi:hypothetical protein
VGRLGGGEGCRVVAQALVQVQQCLNHFITGITALQGKQGGDGNALALTQVVQSWLLVINMYAQPLAVGQHVHTYVHNAI